MSVVVGEVYQGKVTGITKFAAFVGIGDGKSGMVHISEIAYSFVNDIREHLTEGQEVKVRVISVDQEGRINLSIKKAADPAPRERGFSRPRAPAVPAGPPTFEDKLKDFMQKSENKMSDLKFGDKRPARRRTGKDRD